jgi:anti-sigma factor RsiW
MNCREIAELTPLYLSGELDGSKRALMHGHLAECRSCSDEMERQAAIDAQLRDSLGSELPDATAVEGRVRDRIRMERSRRWIVGTAAAAGVLIAVVLGARAGRPERLYTDAALDHRLEVMEHQPRRWRTDPAEIEKLTARYPLPNVAALAPAGYSLEHAKMCGLEGQPALHLVYTNGVQEVSIFVRGRVGTATAIHAVRLGSEHLAGFQTDRLEAVVATSGSSEECLKFARSAAAVL